jgi:hypothetical protein
MVRGAGDHEMSDARYLQRNTAFTMTCVVETDIRTTPDVVWTLLTDAKGFPRWNSTVTAIEGRIREGERLRIHAPGTKRTFTPTVSDVETFRRMTWSNGFAPVFKGVRTFALDGFDGSTRFAMREHFSGVMFALTRRMLPDFRPIFEAYANDLRREAERIAMKKRRSA